MASDGLGSFVDLKNGSMSYDIVKLMQQISDIKSSHGSFLKRRMKRIVKELTTDRIVHYDDISIGAIILDHED